MTAKPVSIKSFKYKSIIIIIIIGNEGGLKSEGAFLPGPEKGGLIREGGLIEDIRFCPYLCTSNCATSIKSKNLFYLFIYLPCRRQSNCVGYVEASLLSALLGQTWS